MPSIADRGSGKKPTGSAHNGGEQRIGNGNTGGGATASTGSGIAPSPAGTGFSPLPAPGSMPSKPMGSGMTRTYGSPGMKKAQRLLMTAEKIQELNQDIGTLNFFINHGYLQQLGGCELAEPVAAVREAITLLRVTKLVISENEDSYEKLISIFTSMYHANCPIGIVVHSRRGHVKFYLYTNLNDDGVAAEHLGRLMRGTFPGTDVEMVSSRERDEILDAVEAAPLMEEEKHIASVSAVPSRRKKESETREIKISAQGIEKLMDTMDGRDFTLLIMAYPVPQQEIDMNREGLENMFTMLSPFAKEQISYSENESDATSYSLTSSLSTSVADSISKSFGTNQNHGTNTSRGKNRGHSNSVFGFGFNSGSCWSTGTTDTSGTSEGTSKSFSRTTGESNGTASGDTHTKGSSRTMNLTRDIKTVTNCLARLEAEIARINANRSFGMWNCACYVVSAEQETVSMTAASLLALLSGDEDYGGDGSINLWNYHAEAGRVGLGKPNRAELILKYLSQLRHPVFLQETLPGKPMTQLTPGLMVSGRDMPVMLSLPQRSTNGVEVLTMAEFGRNFPVSFSPAKPVVFGSVWHMGVRTQTPIRMDLNKFASHCFICGASGSGKSNTTYHLIRAFQNNNIPCLIIEPAKGEYKTFFAGMPHTSVYTCKPDRFRMLYLNPFQFNEKKVTLLEHMARLNGVLQSCWPLYGPMPGMLKDAVERAYLACGWDLQLNRRIVARGKEFPTVEDLLVAIEDIISHSPYPNSTKGEYRGALGMRIRSLLTGFEGTLFGCTLGLSDQELFEKNAIVDLSAIGNAETRSLVMGVLITRLAEYRMGGQPGGLKHITVLEEAHNIFKRCSREQSADAGNVQGAAVGMLVDSVAEMRSAGEGFLIIDQSPGAVDITAIKNTAIKIAMRLPEEEDCKAIGNALSLLPEQIRELSRLPVGVAAIFHDGWHETILGKLGEAWFDVKESKTWSVQPAESVPYALTNARGAITQWLVAQIAQKNVSVFATNTQLNSFLEKLRDVPTLSINKPNWEDLCVQARQVLKDLQQSGINLKDENAHESNLLKEMIGKAVRQMLQMDGLFRLCPLEIPGYDSNAPENRMAPGVMLESHQEKAVMRWFRNFRDLLGKYLVMPEKFQERIRATPVWIPGSVKENRCEFVRTTEACILYSKAVAWRRENAGNTLYMAAYNVLMDKYLREDEAN